MKSIIWMGSSKEDLDAFPRDAKHQSGYQLELVQRGEEPDNWKPMATVGSGVKEIRVHEASGAFRAIYLENRPEAVYVLHCFQKKTEKTTLHDINLAKKRFKAIPPQAKRGGKS